MSSTLEQIALDSFTSWYGGLPRYSGGSPAKGTIAGALVVLERLKEEYVLDIDAHTAKGGSQIRGASGPSVKKLLADFGETRPFVSEGGRTNRGLRGDITTMLRSLSDLGLEDIDQSSRSSLLRRLQEFLVEKVGEFHSRQRLKFVFDPSGSARQWVRELLSNARETGKAGPVAQYLVGAKLQLRFPDEPVSNDSYSAADLPTGRVGDFLVQGTAFHVTVSPMQPVYDRCRANIEQGLRVYLLVQDEFLAGARVLADGTAPGKIAVESIESFVGQNLDEMATFSKAKVSRDFRRLLELYNQRVDAVEIDKSMLVEIPPNLTDE